MKNAILFGVIFAVFAVSVSAQSLYFDLNFGLGKAYTKIDGEDEFDALEEAWAVLMR